MYGRGRCGPISVVDHNDQAPLSVIPYAGRDPADAARRRTVLRTILLLNVIVAALDIARVTMGISFEIYQRNNAGNQVSIGSTWWNVLHCVKAPASAILLTTALICVRRGPRLRWLLISSAGFCVLIELIVPLGYAINPDSALPDQVVTAFVVGEGLAYAAITTLLPAALIWILIRPPVRAIFKAWRCVSSPCAIVRTRTHGPAIEPEDCGGWGAIARQPQNGKLTRSLRRDMRDQIVSLVVSDLHAHELTGVQLVSPDVNHRVDVGRCDWERARNMPAECGRSIRTSIVLPTIRFDFRERDFLLGEHQLFDALLASRRRESGPSIRPIGVPGSWL